MRSLWQRLWQDPPPTLACEFSAHALAVARWSAGSSKPEAIAVRALPEGALRPSPVRENLLKPDEVAEAVASALEEISFGGPKVGREIVLLLPDLSARVSLLDFEELPEQPEETLSLVKFRLKKAVPFDVEQAAISYHLQGREALVAVAPREVIRQYEAILEELGCAPGLVTLSTLAGLGLVETVPAGAGGTMLLRDFGNLVTIAILSQDKLRVLRVTELAPEGSPSNGAVEEIFHDVYSSAVFFEDHYGGSVRQVLLPGVDDRSERLAAMVEAELGVRAQPLQVPARSAEQAGFLGIFGMVKAMRVN